MLPSFLSELFKKWFSLRMPLDVSLTVLLICMIRFLYLPHGSFSNSLTMREHWTFCFCVLLFVFWLVDGNVCEITPPLSKWLQSSYLFFSLIFSFLPLSRFVACKYVFCIFALFMKRLFLQFERSLEDRPHFAVVLSLPLSTTTFYPLSHLCPLSSLSYWPLHTFSTGPVSFLGGKVSCSLHFVGVPSFAGDGGFPVCCTRSCWLIT